MLANSPPLPLTVDYSSEDDITAEDEKGILLALEQRDRLRHLRLICPVQNLQKFIMAIDEEFPILEYLIIYPPLELNTALVLPETLRAPNLHHLMLHSFACPIRPRLHPTATGLVTLCLIMRQQSAYIQPNILLQWISLMPQLESLEFAFSFPVPNRDVGRQLTHTPIATHITLPNLRLFWFGGVSAYLEAVLCRITTPRLEKLQILLFKQLTFSVPRLPQFLNTTEILRFDNARIVFKDKAVDVLMFFREANMSAFRVWVDCWHLDWQVSSVAQICNALSQVFSVVEHLTLEHEVHGQSSEEHNHVDRIEWRKLLRSFSNVKTFRVEDGLVEQLSRCLRLEDGELPLELLPELQELVYFGSRDTGDAFTSCLDARQNAGRPVTLVRQIHPALAAPSLLYDVRTHPSQAHYNPRLSPAVLTTFASCPPLPSLALRVGDPPWLFTVYPDAGHSPGNAFVTVQDVLLAIYIRLRRAVKRDEYEAVSKSRKAEIFRAFESRVGTDSDPIQRGKGLRYLDFLGGRFRAQGLVSAQSKDNVWDLVIH
jgi:hypothetical protein